MAILLLKEIRVRGPDVQRMINDIDAWIQRQDCALLIIGVRFLDETLSDRLGAIIDIKTIDAAITEAHLIYG